MKFTTIKLADGSSGARPGQGLKRDRDHYVASSNYGIGTTANATANNDYYAVWNNWPVFSGSNGDHTNDVSSTDLSNIGIDTLTVACKGTHASGTLDVVIVRKSDRRAVRVTITGSTSTHYKAAIVANATIAEVDPKDGPWTPEIGRLVNMGYIG
jgi:hypothetical protein